MTVAQKMLMAQYSSICMDCPAIPSNKSADVYVVDGETSEQN
jgi:hypothetical protein